jgi:hypothetical protein
MKLDKYLDSAFYWQRLGKKNKNLKKLKISKIPPKMPPKMGINIKYA